MADIYENEETEEINEEVPLTKIKKQRTQKQMEAFEKVKQKRKENLEAKKQEKLINSAKILIEEETKRNPISKRIKPVEREIDTEEEEEEVIIVKKTKPKRGLCPHASPDRKRNCKVRKIIIEESSSSEEEEQDELEYEPEPEPPKRKQRVQSVRVIRPNPNDFFC